jgi:hypothetical protein
MPDMGVRHVIPLNDEQDHLETSREKDPGWKFSDIICDCPCQPRRILANDGVTIIFIHRSYDGREALEETLAILGQYPPSEKGWGVFPEQT